MLDAARSRSASPAHPLANAGLLAGPPATVVGVLAATGNAPLAFVTYHVGWCLVVPAVLVLATGGSLSRLADVLAVSAPSREGWLAGLAVGAVSLLGILGLFASAGTHALDADGLRAALAAWGIGAGAGVGLFVYMVVFNSLAEELYWRGFVHGRLRERSGPRTTLLLATAFFTSYHVYTIHVLAARPTTTALGAAGVFLGGLVWALMRERYESVVPAALAHVGATAGYMTAFLTFA